MKKFFKTFFRFLLLIIILIFSYLIIKNTYSKYLTKQDTNALSHIAQWHILINDQDISQNKVISDSFNLKLLDSDNHVARDLIAPGSIGIIEFDIESTKTELDYMYDISINKDLPSDLFDNNHNEIQDFRIYAYDVRTLYIYQDSKNESENEDGTGSEIENENGSETETGNESGIETGNINEEEEENKLDGQTPLKKFLVPADQSSITGKVTKATSPDYKVVTQFTLYVKWDDSETNFTNDSQDVALSKIENINGKINLDIKISQAQEKEEPFSSSENPDNPITEIP